MSRDLIAPYGHADRVAEDKDHDLSLLRIYGAPGLKPLALAGGNSARNGVELTGIADPQSQGGASATSSAKAQVTPSRPGNDLALSPPPPPGFSGAAALDADGKFAGIALLKPATVAGSAAVAPSQAVLIPPEIVRDFAKSNGVNATGGSGGAKTSVVRVICVRK